MLRLAVTVATLTAALSFLGACKQGEGESCQVDSDCKGSLVCSRNLRICVIDPGDEVDASGMVHDAAPADAWPIDAGPLPLDAEPLDAEPLDAPL